MWSSSFTVLCLALAIVYATSSQLHVERNSTSSVETLLNDIECAFKPITTATKSILRKRIIPKMYNLTNEGILLFKIPDKENKLGYKMIATNRDDMLMPVFPNVTEQRMELMLKKKQQKADVRNTAGTDAKKNSTNTNANVWSSLGLEGWLGEITEATESLESGHKNRMPDYPKDEFLLDFRVEKGTNDTKLASEQEYNKTANKTVTDTKDIAQNSTLNLSANIYIARVNDPFGYSTKWQFRNKTEANDDDADERQKRDIVELYSMINCATGCEPLNYKSYGCFCGFLGNGIAVDGVDRCCKLHDECYENTNCVSYLQYFVPYVWKCYRGKPLCALNHGEFGGPTSCAALLCHCDMRLSLCLRKFTCPQSKAICKSSFARRLQNLFF